ncbi:MAG: peptidoglycan DD-metalloendopeptidase family protein, partial [Bacteroidales bacterium]
GGYGNLVIIRHNNGLETYYGHLSKIVVEENEVLKAGEVLGYGGNTGRSTGPHLHFETRYMGKAFDPERLICFETGTLRDSIFTLKKHYFNIYSHYGQTDKESMAASGRVTHTIRSGDTLGRLAVKYKTTIVNICKLNGISQNTVLRIGRRIIVR